LYRSNIIIITGGRKGGMVSGVLVLIPSFMEIRSFIHKLLGRQKTTLIPQPHFSLYKYGNTGYEWNAG
jgi:hypothetical protein